MLSTLHLLDGTSLGKEGQRILTVSKLRTDSTLQRATVDYSATIRDGKRGPWPQKTGERMMQDASLAV